MSASWSFPPEDGVDSPWPIFERVLGFPELGLQQTLVGSGVTFAFVMKDDTSPGGWTRGGKRILGTAQMPAVTGSLSGLFDQMLEDTLGYLPDFLIVLNADFWGAASDREREILVAHEAMHCGQELDPFGAPKFRKSDGAPVLGMVGHDVEEFHAIVRRYGAWKSDLVEFKEAFDLGPQTANAGARTVEEAAQALRDVLADAGVTMSVELSRGGTSHRESEADVF
jgi:hypothetical protein